MFTKKEPLSVTYGIGIEEHDQEGRVITCEFEDFYFVTVYTPNSQNELARLDYRMRWEDDFRMYLKKLEEKKPVIVTGDMNVAHKEIDLKNPKTNRKNAGWRIDYFCVSESLKERLKDAKILTDVMGSDHCPIELDMD